MDTEQLFQSMPVTCMFLKLKSRRKQPVFKYKSGASKKIQIVKKGTYVKLF